MEWDNRKTNEGRFDKTMAERGRGRAAYERAAMDIPVVSIGDAMRRMRPSDESVCEKCVKRGRRGSAEIVGCDAKLV